MSLVHVGLLVLRCVWEALSALVSHNFYGSGSAQGGRSQISYHAIVGWVFAAALGSILKYNHYTDLKHDKP